MYIEYRITIVCAVRCPLSSCVWNLTEKLILNEGTSPKMIYHFFDLFARNRIKWEMKNGGNHLRTNTSDCRREPFQWNLLYTNFIWFSPLYFSILNLCFVPRTFSWPINKDDDQDSTQKCGEASGTSFIVLRTNLRLNFTWSS